MVNFLGEWSKKAWVRSTDLPTFHLNKIGYYFKPSLVPISLHPLVAKESPEIEEKLQVQHLYGYLDATEVLETDIINRGLLNLIRGNTPLNIPSDLLEEAYKIYTDEGFHALESYKLKKNIEILTNEPFVPLSTPPTNVVLLEEALNKVSEEYYNLAHLIACCVNETLISGNLLQANDPLLNPSIRFYIESHARDEAKHHLFFTHLFNVIWSHLLQHERKKISMILPLFIKSFLSINFSAVRNNLFRVGFSQNEVEEIIQDSYLQKDINEALNKSSKATLRIFAQNGVFNISSVRDCFINEGFTIPS